MAIIHFVRNVDGVLKGKLSHKTHKGHFDLLLASHPEIKGFAWLLINGLLELCKAEPFKGAVRVYLEY